MHLLTDEESCIKFLLEKGVFYNERICLDCNARMRLLLSRKQFRCCNRDCEKQVSIRANSFFSQSKLPIQKILLLGYLWLSKVSVSSCILISGCSSTTISAFVGYFRQLVADNVEIEDVKIGGPQIIVQIDETKLGKRKYNRGHRVEGVWVVGGVEMTPERKCFFIPVETRDENTLLNIIASHVLPGSIVYSDLWRGYFNLTERTGLIHMTVNHSLYFRDPNTGVNTNMIEGTWNGLKLRIPPRNRVASGMEEHLWEFIWRRKNANDLWNALLTAMSESLYE